jgi:hypothetical protein
VVILISLLIALLLAYTTTRYLSPRKAFILSCIIGILLPPCSSYNWRYSVQNGRYYVHIYFPLIKRIPVYTMSRLIPSLIPFVIGSSLFLLYSSLNISYTVHNYCQYGTPLIHRLLWYIVICFIPPKIACILRCNITILAPFIVSVLQIPPLEF